MEHTNERDAQQEMMEELAGATWEAEEQAEAEARYVPTDEPRYAPRAVIHPKKRRRSSRGAVFALLLGCAVLVLFIVSSGAAEWISEHIILPVQGFFGIKEQEESPTEPVFSQETPDPADSTTQRAIILFDTKTQYCLQMGYYNDAVSANIQANSLQAIGGAGYVYFDGQKYRVFASAYGDLSSVDKVLSQIQSDGYDAATYLLQTSAAELTVQGTDADLEMLANCGQLSDRILNLVYAFDKRETEQAAIISALTQIQTELTSSYASAARFSELQPIASYLSFCNAEISALTAGGAGMAYTEFSAKLKHLQVGVAVAYHEAVGDI